VYLPSELVKTAQRNLSSSRADRRLTDYLVFKRALVLSGGPTAVVVSGTRSAEYQQALSDWTRSGLQDDAVLYFNPFESVHTKTGGYRTGKYTSNGPDNTWGGWQSALDPTPVVHVRGSKNPKEFAFSEISAIDLARHFLNSDSSDSALNLPRLIDLAIWWLRDRDLETLDITPDSLTQDLIDVLIEEAGLTATEISAVFDSTDQTLDAT